MIRSLVPIPRLRVTADCPAKGSLFPLFSSAVVQLDDLVRNVDGVVCGNDRLLFQDEGVFLLFSVVYDDIPHLFQNLFREFQILSSDPLLPKNRHSRTDLRNLDRSQRFSLRPSLNPMKGLLSLCPSVKLLFHH